MKLQNVSQIFQNPERTISGTSNTVQADDYILLCDTSTGVVNVELLEIPNNFDREYKLYIIDDSGNAATNNITINAPAGHLINGDASITIDKDNGSVILRFVKENNYAAFGTLDNTTATNNNFYTSDGTFINSPLKERIVDMDNYNLAFINPSNVGIGMQPIDIGNSTEPGGINSIAQFHVAGAIRTDNWYHGRYGLLLHQPSDSSNLSCGYLAMNSITTGTSNVAYGSTALRDVQNGLRNVGIGGSALNLLISGRDNVAIGVEALQNYNSNFNVAIGYQSQKLNVSGSRAISIGHQSMINSISGTNIGIGYRALYNHTITTSAIAIGNEALLNYADTFAGQRNMLAIGHNAAQHVETGKGNIFIGNFSGPNVDDNLNNNIFNCVFVSHSANQAGIGPYYSRHGFGGNDVYTDYTMVIGAGRTSNAESSRQVTKLYVGEGQYRGNSQWNNGDYSFTLSGTDVFPTGLSGQDYIDRQAEGDFVITGGSGTGTGNGRSTSIGASLPDAVSGTDNNAVTKLLTVLGSAMVDQTTNVQIVFDNGGVLTTRKIEVGPVDSAGAGYRQLRILN